MKKYAFLFGNTNGLVGVQKDLQTFRDFLMSPEGGAWIKSEISDLHENMTSTALKLELMKLKQRKLDYLIVYFSGHGGSVREKSYIYPSDNAFIEISELENLATRQLNIYDCCRSVDSYIQKSICNFSMQESANNDWGVRAAYDNRIMQAAPQQMSLYSCALGEYSIDDDGGIFTRNLLDSAMNIKSGEKLVVDAFNEAMKQTNLNTEGKQNPKCRMLKLLPEQQLIISKKFEHLYG